MDFFVGVTDKKWFDYLRQLQPEEVNFWLPNPTQGFREVNKDGLFLFKLKYPHNVIVGGGYFVHYSELPLSISWEVFGNRNGASDYVAFQNNILPYQKKELGPDPIIGNVVLTMPFFFSNEEYIPAPSDWGKSIVRGKKYDTHGDSGEAIWLQVKERLPRYQQIQQSVNSGKLSKEKEVWRYGKPYLTSPRLGQGGFRVLVTEAYQRRCAVTGEKTLPVLTAAHIKPYYREGPHDVQNGMLLRSDIHLLFDRGLLTVTEDYHVEVSSRIRTEYGNGRQYYAMHGQKLAMLPDHSEEKPSNVYLEWHNKNVYVE